MQSHGALEGEREFCPPRGHETRADGLSATPVLVRPAGITFLAGLQFFAAVFSLIVVLAILSSEPKPLTVVVFGGMAALLAYCSYSLWTLRPQGRTIQLTLAWIGLAAFPAGTMMSIPVLYYLFRPSIRILFSGKPADQRLFQRQVRAVAQADATVAADRRASSGTDFSLSRSSTEGTD